MYQPKRNWCVVQKVEGRTTEAGLVLPDMSKDQIWVKVVAVGPGIFSEKLGKRIPTDAKVGDYVVIAPEGPPVEFVTHGGLYALVRDNWIIATIPEEDRRPMMVQQVPLQ